ncbi:hypothetical protein [Streptomyces eurythermus]|uniref:hypothetical protein n=1 Tax=Streptomyces eurythermus TaxID=42237 RepID=UPI0033FBC6CA
MTVEEFRYPAYVLQETEGSKKLLLFSANAVEIDRWVGVPQKRRLAGEETVGWQREENQGRLKELAKFFSDDRNVIQNPLLCALQDSEAVVFEPLAGHPNFGELVVRIEPLKETSLLESLERLCLQLEERVPSLRTHVVDPARRRAVIEQARVVHSWDGDWVGEELSDDENEEDESPAEERNGEDTIDFASALLTEETQIVDFYQELKIRAEILRTVPESERPREFVGFSAEAMQSYLRPVVLVDGQHRLHGAVKAAQLRLDSERGQELLAEMVDEGLKADVARDSVLKSFARQLPISLLLDDSPSEHVFQFVVVNQKATPMPSALLGTIVSTSLSREELEPVADRLREAAIPLDDSQAVAFMTRSPESPFKNLVQTGMTGDQNRLLPWTVLKSLTTIFRELKGGKIFGSSLDYADLWKRELLGESDLVEEAATADEKFKLWKSTDGPWRDVALRFFREIRERFGDDDPGANNAWGNTDSNLYNKISLTILSADYFQFLTDRRLSINSVDDVRVTMDEWLKGVSTQYFAREWKVGLKKDQRAVREKWAKTWVEYRKNPVRLPGPEKFKP